MEVCKAIDKLNNGKSTGPDEIPVEVLKILQNACLQKIAAVMTDNSKGEQTWQWEKEQISESSGLGENPKSAIC